LFQASLIYWTASPHQSDPVAILVGQQQSSMGGKIVRTIGIARARFKVGMMNLGYNIRRLVQLERMAPAPA
jgi:hypothetical protein